MGLKIVNLQWPVSGIIRRQRHGLATDIRSAAHRRGGYSSPWAVNCRPEDAIALRLRGGSRVGLTKYAAASIGTAVTSMIPLDASSATGVKQYLVAVADNKFVLLSGAAPVAVTNSTVAAGCFLTARGGKAYGITASAVYVLDPATATGSTLTVTSGTLPASCTFGTVYRDRLVMAGKDNAIYLSRQSDFGDWNYGANVTDQSRAVPFQLSESWEVGSLTTALVSHKDTFLLAATRRSIWVVEGDPCATGALRCVSRDVGIVGSEAWCKVGDSILFLSKDGIYSVSASGSDLTALSKESLPSELRNVTATARLAHKETENGIHIFLTPGTGDGQHWFFDFENRGFWLDSMVTAHQPSAVCEIDGDVVLAGADGYLRKIGGDDDDGTDIESHALLGPIQLGVNDDFGLIQKINGTLGDGSDPITWRIVSGENPEEACENAKTAIGLFQAGSSTYANYVHSSGTWSEGKSHVSYPRTRAMWAVLWLQSTGKWVYESVAITTKPTGRWR